MHATRPAVEKGTLPGGGVALLRAVKALARLKGENDDQRHGIEIVKKAITYPARQIAINAGEDGSVLVGKILERDTYACGYDAQTGEYANLVSKGIIDPTKVTAGRGVRHGSAHQHRGDGCRVAEGGNCRVRDCLMVAVWTFRTQHHAQKRVGGALVRPDDRRDQAK
jgi:TCP-1/cpn60 chaperonin family